MLFISWTNNNNNNAVKIRVLSHAQRTGLYRFNLH